MGPRSSASLKEGKRRRSWRWRQGSGACGEVAAEPPSGLPAAEDSAAAAAATVAQSLTAMGEHQGLPPGDTAAAAVLARRLPASASARSVAATAS